VNQKLRHMITEVFAARAVLVQLVRQLLILRYRRTMLGYFWTLINPLMMMTVTAVVFANLFKQDLRTFTIFMFAGMIPWNCFSSMVIQSTTAFINNEGLIKKIYLPKLLFPLSVCLALAIDSLLSLIALFAIMFIIGAEPSWSLLFLPIAYCLLFLFGFGIALVASVITVFFRDLQHVIVIAMQALFFLTPIIYEKKSFDGTIAFLLHINPVTPFVEMFRAPLRYGMMPDATTITHAAILSIISLVIGISFFLVQEKKIVFRL
jgi:ABC-type polysaccharide/polyol phosphate export permease